MAEICLDLVFVEIKKYVKKQTEKISREKKTKNEFFHIFFVLGETYVKVPNFHIFSMIIECDFC